MASKPLDISDLVGSRDELACYISDLFTELESRRAVWMSERSELRDYLFATDTRSTSNARLPWKNSVHIPKLCQIRDNLHANYMATLFPNDNAIRWEGDDEDSDALKKRSAIEAYMANKLRMSGFRNEVQKTLLDWIDNGNAFARVVFDNERYTDPLTGEQVTTYVGPRMVRVSVNDIVFDPTAHSFDRTPKILRTIKTMASIAAEAESQPEQAYMMAVLDKSRAIRSRVASVSRADSVKNRGYQMDGFGTWFDYFKTDNVEVLEFFGDIYKNGKLERNQHITIIDRAFVLHQETHPTWMGSAPIFHVGWRIRPDNLYAMGPLDNLVGMQYRIDHLENAKADAYDMIMQPVMKIRGYVEDFEYGPLERIYTDQDGDVEFMRPDVTMLSADTQIQLYEAKMEEMAGAPKQAMGFRSPGEKTAYEIQILENGANRVFINKTSYFEEMFIEPVLNAMLESARRNMGTSDLIRVMDDQYGVTDFMAITKEDIVARGKIRPIAARHFARNANILQNLTQFAASPLGQSAAVTNHISGKKLAKLVEQLLGIERFGLVMDNVRIAEELESAQQRAAAEQIYMQQQGASQGGSINGMAGGPQPPAA